MSNPPLTQLCDQPDLTVTLGSREYGFSELPLAALAELQTWIKAHVPHPIEALKGHLGGLDPADRAALLEAARVEARSWPPEIGTAAGAAALLGTEPGQVEAIYHGLRVHHPETTREGAAQVFRELRRDSVREASRARREGRAYDGEGTAKRIFGALFGLDDGDSDGPKG